MLPRIAIEPSDGVDDPSVRGAGGFRHVEEPPVRSGRQALVHLRAPAHDREPNRAESAGAYRSAPVAESVPSTGTALPPRSSVRKTASLPSLSFSP